MKPGSPLNVTVMLGGFSAERQVSLESGAAVADALAGRGHTVRRLDVTNEHWQLPPATDVVFLALHGTYGEDGAVQRRLDELGVPYTGCDAEASRVAFDKVLTKERCLANGVPTPRFKVLSRAQTAWPDGWAPPVVLKPARQGSSVGLEFVNAAGEFAPAMARALEHGPEVLLEERITGRELTVGLLDGEVLPVVEIRPRGGAYDFHHKYTRGATEYLVPAPLSAEVTRSVQAAGLGAFQAVGARDYARVDVMLGRDDQPLVLEINTLPGMTATSLLPQAAAKAGYDFATLCQRMLDLALRRARGGTV
jgi:D-alanine-D-alanine ligase